MREKGDGTAPYREEAAAQQGRRIIAESLEALCLLLLLDSFFRSSSSVMQAATLNAQPASTTEARQAKVRPKSNPDVAIAKA